MSYIIGIHNLRNDSTLLLHNDYLLFSIPEERFTRKKNDEVLCSSLTFVADANVVTMLKATPVFYDVKSLKDWNPSIETITSKVTFKTKAIILVHFAGYPIEDIEKIATFCKKNNIILIEDVAHAIGASYKGQKCGTFGDMSCFSFFANKNLSTGEGGMFVTKSKKHSEKARLYRSHGMTSMTIDRHKGNTISYDVVQTGLNYRIDEMRSALGCVQLKKLDNNNRKRKLIVSHYKEQIQSMIPTIIVPFANLSEYILSSYHILPILLPSGISRIEVMEKLKKSGIQTSIHYPSFKALSFYKSFSNEPLQFVDEISSRVLTLPLYANMSKKMVNIVVDKLKESI